MSTVDSVSIDNSDEIPSISDLNPNHTLYNDYSDEIPSISDSEDNKTDIRSISHSSQVKLNPKSVSFDEKPTNSKKKMKNKKKELFAPLKTTANFSRMQRISESRIEQKRVRFEDDSNEMYNDEEKMITEEEEQTKKPRHTMNLYVIQKQQLHNDTQNASEFWLCNAKKQKKFKSDMESAALEDSNPTLLQITSKEIDSAEDRYDGWSACNKNSCQWFTKKADSPNSIESHESYWDGLMNELQECAECSEMAVQEDQTFQQLKEEIAGKWTRRFVQKRTKPKIVNSLNKERLNILRHFIEDDHAEWAKKESIYTNLSVRVRLHAESIVQICQVCEEFEIVGVELQQMIIPAVCYLMRGINIVDDRCTPKYHLIFCLALANMFDFSLNAEYEKYSKRISYETVDVTNHKINNNLHSFGIRKNIGEIIYRTKNLILPEHRKAVNLKKTDTDVLFSVAKANILRKRKQNFQSAKFRNASKLEMDINSESDVNIPEYPDLKVMSKVINDLCAAGKQLNKVLWKTHDKYKDIDDEIAIILKNHIHAYGDFDSNPLTNEPTQNFNQISSNLFTLLHTANYCRRRIQSCLLSSLLLDYKECEINTSNIILQMLSEFVKYALYFPQPGLTLELWNIWSMEAEKNPNFNYTHDSGQAFTDMIDVGSQALHACFTDGLEFVTEELNEVERLITAQVITQGPLTIYEYQNILQTGAFDCMVPVYMPSKIQMAEIEAEETENLDDEHGSVGYKLRCFACLLVQGWLFLFEDEEMTHCVLTVDVKLLESIHIENEEFDILMSEGNQMLSDFHLLLNFIF